MSIQFKRAIICPECNGYYEDNFFRTIWGENKYNHQIVMENCINIVTCLQCDIKYKC